MKRFHPAARPFTLRDKALSALDDRRFGKPDGRRVALQVVGNPGMDGDARAALARILELAESRRIGVAGMFMPDAGVSSVLARRGIVEGVEEADFGRFHRIVIPYGGVAAVRRREWERSGVPLEDLSSPAVRRAQASLGLLHMEGAQCLVIGRHDDPESQALCGSWPGCRILEDTTDTARLRFAPAFGAICQTTLSPLKVAWLVQQLRFRYRDSRVTFLDTSAAAMAVRTGALEKRLPLCDQVVIVGQAGEATCEALAETAARRGRPALILECPEQVSAKDFPGNPRVALTAGGFALDETIRTVAEALLEIRS